MRCIECGKSAPRRIRSGKDIFCSRLCKWRYERLAILAIAELLEVSEMNYIEDKIRWRYG